MSEPLADLAWRPGFHAALNGTAAVLLGTGWLAITGRLPGGRREGLHKGVMLLAVAVSTVFLASYVDYHATIGHQPFRGEGALATLYFAVLVPHVVLAALMVPPIVVLLVAALRGRLAAHRRLARWTLPVWLYVSVTGVLIYLIRGRWEPPL